MICHLQVFLCRVSDHIYKNSARPLTQLFLSVQEPTGVQIIANDQGNRITPSWVGFTDDDRLYGPPFPVWYVTHNISPLAYSIGDSAKNAYPSNPSNTVFDAKRLIGRKVNDPDVLRDIKHWPFSVSEKNGKPAISVKHKGEIRNFVSPFAWPSNVNHDLPVIPLDRRGNQCDGSWKDERDCRELPRA